MNQSCSTMHLANSPVTEHVFNGQRFFLKRDDLLHPQFSGNKARKLMTLLATPNARYHTLISYGSAQSNAMYSLAALANIKGWKFEYYVQYIPAWLKANPIGNYRAAIKLGMTIYSMQNLQSLLHPIEYIDQIRKIDTSTLLVPEGGRAVFAEAGIKQLAEEIIQWVETNKLSSCTLALPSGTGATALYLQKHLKNKKIEVLTCPCVADAAYLTQQFTMLEKHNHPTILSLVNKHHFGRLYQSEYQIWQSLLSQTKIEFDLLYDPYMWQCLEPWFKQNKEKTLLYIHQGGLLGNESMLPRYQRAVGNFSK